MRDDATLLASYPAPVSVTSRRIARESADDRRVLVVLDDDPTGTQSVSDLPVVTVVQNICAGIAPCFVVAKGGISWLRP